MMAQWVQHISGQGRTFPVLDSSGFCWKVHLSDLEQDCWIPKSEYVPCDPPTKQWVDVTEECEVAEGAVAMDEPTATLRDQFAMAALASMELGAPAYQPDVVAEAAYAYADALLKARELKRSHNGK